MKKLLLPLLCMALLLAACDPTEEVNQPEQNETVIETGSQEKTQTWKILTLLKRTFQDLGRKNTLSLNVDQMKWVGNVLMNEKTIKPIKMQC